MKNSLMDRRAFLQTVGIGTTTALAGSQFARDTVEATEPTETSWTRPWGSTGQTRFSESHNFTDPNGQLDWESRGGNWSGTPTVSDGILYVGELTDDIYSTGSISAYDAKSGNQLWSVRKHPVTEKEKERVEQSSKQLLKESSAPYGFLTHSPVVENGVIYAIGRSSGDGNYYVAQGVYALDAKSGEEIWARTDLVDYSTLEVANGLVYLSGLALDAKTGDTAWGTSADERVIGVVDDTLYTSAIVDRPNEEIAIFIARNARTGDERWRALSPFNTGNFSKAVDEDFLYLVPHEDDTPLVYALSTTNGQVEWKTTLSVREGTTDVSAPAVDNNSLYLFTRGTDDTYMSVDADTPVEGVGTAFALNRETGTEQWRYETPAAFAGNPTVGSDSVYGAARYHACSVYSNRPVRAGIYSFDKQTGVKRWTYAIKNLYSVFSPALSENQIFLATNGLPMGVTIMYAFRGCECSPHCSNQFVDDGKRQTRTQTTDEPEITPSSETSKRETTTTSSSSETTVEEEINTVSPAETTDKVQTTISDPITNHSSTTKSTTSRQRSQTSTSITSTVSKKTSVQTTVSDGQPGFSVLGTFGSLISGGLYALYRLTDGDNDDST